MIPVEKESAIADLLGRGLPQRRIASLVGVSRGTVGAIATGRRPVHLRRPAQQAEEPRRMGRCPTCGRQIMLPCLACAAGEGPHIMSPRPDDAGACQLDLHGEVRHRYERLRRYRQQARLDAIEADLDAWQEGRGDDELDLLPPFGAVDEPLERPDPSPEPDLELWEE